MACVLRFLSVSQIVSKVVDTLSVLPHTLLTLTDSKETIMKNLNIKLIVTISAVLSLFSIVIGTPAMAQSKTNATVSDKGTIVFGADRIVVKPCKVRALDQGSGNVKICESN